MKNDADEFGVLLDALRDAGLTIPDEVTDVRGLIIAVKAGGGPRRSRGVIPLRPRVAEADGAAPDDALLGRMAGV